MNCISLSTVLTIAVHIMVAVPAIGEDVRSTCAANLERANAIIDQMASSGCFQRPVPADKVDHCGGLETQHKLLCPEAHEEREDTCTNEKQRLDESRKAYTDACSEAKFGGSATRACYEQAEKCSGVLNEFADGTRIGPGSSLWFSNPSTAGLSQSGDLSSEAQDAMDQCRFYGAQGLKGAEDDLKEIERRKRDLDKDVGRLKSRFEDQQESFVQAQNENRRQLAEFDASFETAQAKLSESVATLSNIEEGERLRMETERQKISDERKANAAKLTDENRRIGRELRVATLACEEQAKAKAKEYYDKLKATPKVKYPHRVKRQIAAEAGALRRRCERMAMLNAAEDRRVLEVNNELSLNSLHEREVLVMKFYINAVENAGEAGQSAALAQISALESMEKQRVLLIQQNSQLNMQNITKQYSLRNDLTKAESQLAIAEREYQNALAEKGFYQAAGGKTRLSDDYNLDSVANNVAASWEVFNDDEETYVRCLIREVGNSRAKELYPRPRHQASRDALGIDTE